MQWEDSGIILRINKHGENSAILSVLTENHGRHSGMVKGAFSSRLRNSLMTGNQLRLSWNARLSEHLGMFSAELEKPYAAMIMDSPKRLRQMQDILRLIDKTLPEREAHPDIYKFLHHWQEMALSEENDARMEMAAICLSAMILRDMGYGIDVSSCAASGETDELIYISPKSARAVSRRHGEQYADKLLRLPEFLRAFLAGDEYNETPATEELEQARISVSYFIDSRLIDPV